jgi:D-lyxose ketol-isomerase
MNRSEINAVIRSADEFIQGCGFSLPPFAYWTPEEWSRKGDEVAEIVENNLGWDITDFGSGDYTNHGLFLFTVRNGNVKNWDMPQGKLYAEKILIVDPDQLTPLHFHWSKMEDIINRSGGNLLIQVYNSTLKEELDTTNPVTLSLDGVRRVFKAGDTFRLKPGESVTLPQRCYHQFWGEKSRVLVGEVSMVNDDHKDNRFYKPAGRFPLIYEDEVPLYLLCGDYAKYYRPGRG